MPIDPENIGVYVCGPTVYDKIHIGNGRAMVVFDLLVRVLKQQYKNVTYVRNITDVDDKINNAARQQSISIQEITKKTIKSFHQDVLQLNCLKPEVEPLATKHIKEMINMIKKLVDNKNAYVVDNHVLFSVDSYDNYGGLSKRSVDELIAGMRISVADFKKNPADFVLWKPSDPEKLEPGWQSPWGFGRPGWHIECSAMSSKYLGVNFDIHGGGADLKFPHHENEIAQSCAANPGSSYAKYWIHNGFVTVNGEKMSKSLNNFITVREILDEQSASNNINNYGQVIRLLLLNTHYAKPLDWSDKSLQDAKKQLDYLYTAIGNSDDEDSIEENNEYNNAIDQDFINALNDDLNTPLAIARLLEMAKEINKLSNNTQKLQLGQKLKNSGMMIGIFARLTVDNKMEYVSSKEWFGQQDGESNEEIAQLITQITEARLNKDYSTADNIRDKLFNMGYIVEYKNDSSIKYKRK
ncbi:MAG: cysteine--tRNA ligase [Pseudomonadota bacterium]